MLTRGHGNSVELLLRRAGMGPPGATLENTYWKLMRIGTTGVFVAERQREPHLILHPSAGRISGSGGCNRLAGSYQVDGDRITFGQMVGTMMACPDGMEHERAFHDVLGKAARWRIEGERLELLDAKGENLASFESRYMH